MSAVWGAAAAAVRRRTLQTVVIGLVVLISTAIVVVALALLTATNGPFEKAFDQQRGAHLVATFDGAVSDAELAATADAAGVETAAGPFALVNSETVATGSHPGGLQITIVGRDHRAGPVDKVDVWEGRWASAPGEIVLNSRQDRGMAADFNVGDDIEVAGATLTIVGFGLSLSHSAGAWVSTEQMASMGPTAAQMLYRVTDNDTKTEIADAVESIAATAPAEALLASSSYLLLEENANAELGIFMVLLVVFGLLGLAVAVLIVANVVGGAVVSGLRHIGVLKALGFTPHQVVAVYLTMVSVPAIVGALIGTAVGHALAQPLIASSFEDAGLGSVFVSPWVDAAAVIGLPLVVLATALIPALRAHRLPAAEAISAGAPTRRGRALRIQRGLGRTRLPRAVSLGLGLPFARPGRTGLTVAAVVLGVQTATFAVGLATTVSGFVEVSARADYVDAVLLPTREEGQPTAMPDAVATQNRLAEFPGVATVIASAQTQVGVVGISDPPKATFIRGDSASMGYPDQLVYGDWFDGAGEAVVTSRFANRQDLALGDVLTIELQGQSAKVEITGTVMGNSDDVLYADWSTLTGMGVDSAALAMPAQYEVALEPGMTMDAYAAAVEETDLGFEARSPASFGAFSTTVIGLSTSLTLMLGTVAALGVFNTVVLNARERRRDLGMLKSIGMTPRQVTTMMVTSMAALGFAGGLLGIAFGVAAHRLVVPLATAQAQIDLVDALLLPWNPLMLAALAVSGLVIAVLGAYVPSRSAGRLTIAEVLRSE